MLALMLKTHLGVVSIRCFYKCECDLETIMVTSFHLLNFLCASNINSFASIEQPRCSWLDMLHNRMLANETNVSFIRMRSSRSTFSPLAKVGVLIFHPRGAHKLGFYHWKEEVKRSGCLFISNPQFQGDSFICFCISNAQRHKRFLLPFLVVLVFFFLSITISVPLSQTRKFEMVFPPTALPKLHFFGISFFFSPESEAGFEPFNKILKPCWKGRMSVTGGSFLLLQYAIDGCRDPLPPPDKILGEMAPFVLKIILDSLSKTGTNTAELGSLGVPMVVVLPTYALEVYRGATGGLLGLLSNAPGKFGDAAAILINTMMLKTVGFLSWPNREVVLPDIICSKSTIGYNILEALFLDQHAF
eukprot:Gb_03300 [translate_table: standard]